MNGVELFFSRSIVQIGEARLTVGAFLSAALILAIALAAIWVLKKFVRRAQQTLGEDRAHSIYIGGQVARYIIVAIGLAVAISALGVDLSALSLFAGALGIGIGLGLRDIVRNFVGGIVILFDRSVEVGDFIELPDGTKGEVRAIGPRATAIVSNDNVSMVVPNAILIDGKVTNWTRNRSTRRMHIPFRVALDADKERVRDVVLEAARNVPFTLPELEHQRTQIWLVEFGDDALHFELVVWPSLSAVKRPGQLVAAYNWAIHDALGANGIAIPLPQRELRFAQAPDQEGAGD